jgi:methionine aminopeptidase
VKGSGDTTRMEEGEFYAIETFGTTGTPWKYDSFVLSGLD